MTRPRYPIYVISKGRWGKEALTARFLAKEGLPFRLVVEPQEADQYAEQFGAARLLILPFSNLGQGSVPARNWVKDHATETGAERHWLLDDNIRGVTRSYRGKRIRCDAGPAFVAIEDFADRYENLALAGMNYTFFEHGSAHQPPFFFNCHVYSCFLILNRIPHRWRGRYNEDTDLCLQVLSDGWCTISTNAFLIDKTKTMSMKGGNSDELYEIGRASYREKV